MHTHAGRWHHRQDDGFDLDPSTPGEHKVSPLPWTVDGGGNVTFTPVLNFNGIATIAPTGYSGALTLREPHRHVTLRSTADRGWRPTTRPRRHPAVTFNIYSNDTDVDGTIDPATVDLDRFHWASRRLMTADGTWTVDASGNVTFTRRLGRGTTDVI